MNKINTEILKSSVLWGLDTFNCKIEILTRIEAETPATWLGIILALEACGLVKKAVIIHT